MATGEFRGLVALRNGEVRISIYFITNASTNKALSAAKKQPAKGNGSIQQRGDPVFRPVSADAIDNAPLSGASVPGKYHGDE